MKKFMRPCAIFLSVVMFLNMMDLGVFAETVQKVMDESNNPYYIADGDKIYDEELSSNSACIVMELEDKRDENAKQFLLSDHSVQAVIYAQPVHYLENGEGKISTIRCNMKVKPLKMRQDIQMRQMIFRFVLRNKRFRMNLFRFGKANINWIGNM